ncbi:MAG: hypothetical protein D3904_13825 [Candidatus Electrothrix sp. EH2]|nr:hypothetical protein [Candidatus Electrothrix sp. EH2]
MYLREEEAGTLFKQVDSAVKKDIKDSIKVLGSLAGESDWTFIVKSHSLVESLINKLLISKINKIELKRTIKFLPLHDRKTSKIDILKSYNLFDKDAYLFLRKFSELRNSIAHSFDNVNFDFSEYYKQLDKNQKKTWLDTVTWYTEDNETETRQLWSGVLDEKSKYAFWIALQYLLFDIYFEIHLAKGKNEIDAIAERSTMELLEKLEGQEFQIDSRALSSRTR